MIKDQLIFLREFLTEFHTTGTVCSTSPWAAEQMAAPLCGDRASANILEVGAGTGAVTRKIMEHMRDGDTLTVCEINPRLMKALRLRMEKEESFLKHRDRINFFEGAIQDLPESESFDVIISALPFLNFTTELVHEIMEKYRRLSNPETTITYYEYIGLRSLGQTFSPPDRKQRLKGLDVYLNELFSEILIGRKRIWANVLPINIYTLRFSELS